MRGQSVLPVAAVDIGGTKVAAALIDHDGRLLDVESIPTPQGDPDDALTRLCGWLRGFLAGRMVGGVGVALPAVTSGGRIEWVAPTLPGWSRLPIAERIAKIAGTPVWCEFDGYAAAQGEIWCGAARSASSAAVLIVGTGIGAGFARDGQVVRGGVGVAGSVGWLRFPDGCGRLGPPVESYASGAGLLRQAREYQPPGSVPFGTTDDVFRAASSGDAAAGTAVEKATVTLASIVLTMMSTLAPEVIVLSGGVGSRPDVVTRVRTLVASTGHPFSGARTTVTASALAGLSSLHGAAYFAYENNRTS